MAYRAYAIRPYNYHKPDIDYFSLNAPKTTWDMGKTMSYAGKIMSDVEKATSDIFSLFANTGKTKRYAFYLVHKHFLVNQHIMQFYGICRFAGNCLWRNMSFTRR